MTDIEIQHWQFNDDGESGTVWVCVNGKTCDLDFRTAEAGGMEGPDESDQFPSPTWEWDGDRHYPTLSNSIQINGAHFWIRDGEAVL